LFTFENTGHKTKPEKANNAEQLSETKPAWFSRLLRHTARKRAGVGLFYKAPEPTRDGR